MFRLGCLTLIAVLGGVADMTNAMAAEAPHITGLGGIFFKSKDPAALTAWYRDVLGLEIQSWGGAMLRTDAPGHPPVVVWTAFPENTAHFAPSEREFMINFGVNDLDGFVKRIEQHGVHVLKREEDATGKFAWIVDPDGTKIELWQPK